MYLDQMMSQRALEELYLAALQGRGDRGPRRHGHVRLPRGVNGTYQCQDPALLGQLSQLGVHRLRPIRPRFGPRPGGRLQCRARPAQAVAVPRLDLSGARAPPDPAR